MKYLNLRQSGITLVEVMVAISIIASIVVAVGFSVTAYVDARSELLNDAKSVYLAEEGYEILRAIRDNDWNVIDVLTIGTTHYLSVSTTSINVSTTPEAVLVVISSLLFR